MKLKARGYHTGELILYRDKYGVIAYALALALACLGFGLGFIYLAEGKVVMQIFGGFFALVGVLLLAGLPRYGRRLRSDDGAVLLRASREGLALAPVLNMAPVHYDWPAIERIVLTGKLVTRQYSETGYSWNQLLVFFRTDTDTTASQWADILDNSRRQRFLAPSGQRVSILDFPKRERARIANTLRTFAPQQVDIQTCKRVEFDYKANRERFTP